MKVEIFPDLFLKSLKEIYEQSECEFWDKGHTKQVIGLATIHGNALGLIKMIESGIEYNKKDIEEAKFLREESA